jgi:predicted Zn-ribbon and HTH transcriptional regulator
MPKPKRKRSLSKPDEMAQLSDPHHCCNCGAHLSEHRLVRKKLRADKFGDHWVQFKAYCPKCKSKYLFTYGLFGVKTRRKG